MSFVEPLVVYKIDQTTYFAFVLVGILYFLVVSHIQTLIALYILL
jgi:hypothetical protein